MKRFLGRAIRRGTLEIVDAEGKTHRFGDGRGEAGARPLHLDTPPSATSSSIPHLKLGEEFMDGGFVVEAGSIYDFLALAPLQHPADRRHLVDDRHAGGRAT